MQPLAEIPVDPGAARVHEQGWQSWSPSTTYRLGQRPYRPVSERARLLCYRPEVTSPPDAFWGEGLLAIDPGGGPVHVVAAADPAVAVPSIRATLAGDRLVVAADGPVEQRTDAGPGGIEGALARWAADLARRAGVRAVRRAPVVWCSWYQYFTQVTEADVLENLDAMDELALPIEVVQVDDGYQAGIGDWLTPSGRFSSLSGLAGRIRERGRRAGIWIAPFLAGARSDLAARNPAWLVRGPDGTPAHAGHNWGQDLFTLDVTHPGAAAWLTEVLATFRGMGFDYFKIDFAYAGALPGRRHADLPPLAAYRRGLALIREAIGPEPYLLGCGAPMLPSVGLVDAMRVSPDTGPAYEPRGGDLSQPSQRAAALTGRARAFMQGRFWINDPDCLIARPGVERREAWAEHVARWGGLRASSDRLRSLDGWGLETTRRLLASSPTEPFVPA